MNVNDFNQGDMVIITEIDKSSIHYPYRNFWIGKHGELVSIGPNHVNIKFDEKTYEEFMKLSRMTELKDIFEPPMLGIKITGLKSYYDMRE